jgi:putative phage-type endonuclease
MPIVEGVEQQSVEWLQMRIGCVTGSRVADVMNMLKRGGESQRRKDYKSEIVCEILTGRAAEHYVTPAMEWGTDNEPLARASYELEFDTEVTPVGFALHASIDRFGASPDGLVGSDGLVEFKCPTTATHIDNIINGCIPEQYQWQMLAELACTDRKWCDFVSFDPRLPKGLQLFVRRLDRDDERIKEMEENVRNFLDEVAAVLLSLTKGRE